MPNRWMDERDRRWRFRPQSERPEPRRGDERESGDSRREDRSFSADSRPDEDRVFGERESGMDYSGEEAEQERRRRRGRGRDDYGASPYYGYDYRRRPPPLGHSYFGFGYDVRGADYDRALHEAGDDYTPNVREGRGEGGRTWWDKTRDEVSSWFGDHDAERRRRWDMETSHRGRGPKGYRRSDERILEEVQDRLTEDHWLDASGIEVKVAVGEVTLDGQVGNRSAKHRAEHLVELVSGVGHVQNNLRVGPSAPAGEA